jgi:hypothetical protein
MKQQVILSEEVIKEIAEQLDCGNNCWYHMPTGEILWAPNRDKEFELDEEIWKEVFDEIDRKKSECIPFECLETHESFRMMESFAEEVGDKFLRTGLITALNNRKPFRNFKALIDNSNYRQAWFAFKDKWYIDYVKDELEWYNKKEEEDDEVDEA